MDQASMRALDWKLRFAKALPTPRKVNVNMPIAPGAESLFALECYCISFPVRFRSTIRTPVYIELHSRGNCDFGSHQKLRSTSTIGTSRTLMSAESFMKVLCRLASEALDIMVMYRAISVQR